MNYTKLIEYYGTQEAAAGAVGLTQMRASHWKRNGIPIERQCQFEILTDGKLKADRKMLRGLAKAVR